MEFSIPFLDELIEELRANNDKLDGIITHLESENDNILVSCSEAARHLGVTLQTVSKMLKEGRLHRVSEGESRGIRFSEVKKLKSQ